MPPFFHNLLMVLAFMSGFILCGACIIGIFGDGARRADIVGGILAGLLGTMLLSMGLVMT